MRALLRLYPRRWRARYGAEFDALLDDSAPGPLRAVDAVLGAVDAHAREGTMAATKLVPWVVLVACDVVIGWLDFHATDDVQPVAAALLVAGFGFGVYRPRLFWLFTVLLWLSIPISAAYAQSVGHHPAGTTPHPLYESLVALIPTALGAAGGATTRWAVNRARASS